MWKLFEQMMGTRKTHVREPLTERTASDLEGRFLHYLSVGKIRTLAAEQGVTEATSTTTTYSAGLGTAANVKTEKTREPNREWPVELAQAVSQQLMSRSLVTFLPDASQRYVAGRCDMFGGTLGALDLKPPAAWFVGIAEDTLILLCGSASNLRDRHAAEERPTWYPSRLDDLSLVVRSIVKADENEDPGSGNSPPFLTEPGKSHLSTVKSLLGVIGDRRSGASFMQGWVDFIALRHFVIPAFEMSTGKYTQILLGSPLWVASYDGNPPPGWYPDPALQAIPGTGRWWDGRQWTDHSYTNGTALSTPAPTDNSKPTGLTPSGRGIGGSTALF